MTANQPVCRRCARPVPDQAPLCTSCTHHTRNRLHTIADTTEDARAAAQRQARRDNNPTTGRPGSRIPLDLTATARLDAVQNELTTWTRHIADERGLVPPWTQPHGDPIEAAARWLTDHLDWLRHRDEAGEFTTSIDAAARILTGITDGPAPRRYLGPCGAPTTPWTDTHGNHRTDCPGDVYGPPRGDTGTCRTCRTTFDQADRSAWLDDQVRHRVFRAAHIADAYNVNVNTIRTWHDRGVLAAHGEDPDGRPLFNVGEVLDAFRALAVRRAERAARRDTRRHVVDKGRSV